MNREKIMNDFKYLRDIENLELKLKLLKKDDTYLRLETKTPVAGFPIQDEQLNEILKETCIAYYSSLIKSLENLIDS